MAFNPHSSNTPCYKIRRSWEKWPIFWVFGLLALGALIDHIFG